MEVGRHIAISPGAVPRFLERMDAAYAKAGKIDSILAAACAHHRLLWVHPFLDGNGRVARLMSYAMLKSAHWIHKAFGPLRAGWPATKRNINVTLPPVMHQDAEIAMGAAR